MDVRHPSISANSNIIAFESNATGQRHIQVYDRLGRSLTIPAACHHPPLKHRRIIPDDENRGVKEDQTIRQQSTEVAV